MVGRKTKTKVTKLGTFILLGKKESWNVELEHKELIILN